MNKFSKAVWEHLKTRKKYNTLEIKLIGAREDIERLNILLNNEKRKNAILKESWEKTLKEQEEEIIKLKKRKIKKESDN